MSMNVIKQIIICIFYENEKKNIKEKQKQKENKETSKKI
jgi:hypothetical protein